ncbi:MAG: SDR family NAD(P)-dependent oxidoreductase [Micavibrio sp.]
MQLEGKQIFITGGTGGIGIPLVQMLREVGANVTVYDRGTDGDLVNNLEKVATKLSLQTPDILINMAGFNDFNYAEDQDYQSIVTLNMLVPMRLCQAVLPDMRRRGHGQIVNIGSMTALIPLPHLTGYVAAKAGLKGFTDSLRRELGGTNINVLHVVPRAVRTSMNTGKRAEINERTGVHHDSPEAVAHHIFEAILNNSREVRIGWPERFFAFIHANFPRVIDRGLQRNRIVGEEILGKPRAQPVSLYSVKTETKNQKLGH